MGILFSNPNDIGYLCGFFPQEIGEAWLWSDVNLETAKSELALYIKSSQLWLFCPQMFIYQANTLVKQNQKLEIVPLSKQSGLIENIQNLSSNTQDVLYIDYNHLNVSQFKAIENKLKHNFKIQNFNSELINLRSLKTTEELNAINKATDIAFAVFDKILPNLKPEVSEIKIAWEIEKYIRENYNAKIAFPTIVAFGKNTSVPHHRPGKDLLVEDTPVLIDWGVNFERYNSDQTRSFWYGSKPNNLYLEIHRLVNRAYENALTKLDSNFSLTEVQADILNDLSQASPKDFSMPHSLGHGIGLDVHEYPSFNSVSKLEPGQAITVEPGLYNQSMFGIRLENTCVQTTEGSIQVFGDKHKFKETQP